MPQAKKQIIDGKLKCSSCKYPLPLNDFFIDNSTSTGRKSCCKVCHKSKYDSKRIKAPYNSGIIGIYLNNCEQCKQDFTTRKSNKVYCTDKCRKRAWYEKNEQKKQR